jgi:N-acyl-D-aspartate/D-glutamate deacylase
MGERGANREPAGAAEIERMGVLVREAIEAGALGFSTSRTLNHRTSRGEPTPTLTAAEDELVGIAAAVGEADAGVFEVVSDFVDFETEFKMLRRMVEVSGRPLSISLVQSRYRESWRALLDAIEGAAADGLPIKGQVGARPIGVVLGLEASLNPFIRYAGWAELAPLDRAGRVALMRDPLFRERLLAEDASLAPGAEHIFDLGDPPDYEPAPEASMAAEAARRGVRVEELVYDLLLTDEGRRLLYYPIFNYVDGNLDALRQMLLSEHTVAGLGDGGAHVGTICDGSYPTTMLTHWARDRTRGERLPLELVVRRQTRDTARAVGLGDRGVLAPGMRADVNVVDFEGLRLRPPEMHFDLPAGGKRLLQRAEGYLHTFVAGVETYAGGAHTGALPGRLVRGAR